MSFDKRDYPVTWRTQRARILERAGNRCEWPTPDGIVAKRCEALNGSLLHRLVRCLEETAPCSAHTRQLRCEHMPIYGWAPPIRIVLTIAHLDEGDTSVEIPDDRLLALCQLHHLRLDAKLHARNAAETRRTKGGLQPRLVGR